MGPGGHFGVVGSTTVGLEGHLWVTGGKVVDLGGDSFGAVVGLVGHLGDSYESGGGH